MDSPNTRAFMLLVQTGAIIGTIQMGHEPIVGMAIVADALQIPSHYLPDDLQRAAEDFVTYKSSLLRGWMGDPVPIPQWLWAFEEGATPELSPE